MVSQVAFHMSRTTPWVSTSGAIMQACIGVLIMVIGMVFVLDIRLLRTRWVESIVRFLNSRDSRLPFDFSHCQRVVLCD
jgi:hypothetical protein